MSRPIRTVVVDDEDLSRRKLLLLLAEEPDVEVVAECAGGKEGVDAVTELRPDLLFLDVQMPGLDGFGVLEALGPQGVPPAVVFVSAYAEFAVRAFEAYALDYLLKPYTPERLQATLARAREELGERDPAAGADPRMEALLAYLKAPTRARYPGLIAIKTGSRYPLVRVEEIDWMEADGNYTRLHAGATVRLVGKSLGELEAAVLDPERFVRIHRSTVVNLSRVVSIEPISQKEYSVILKDGTRLTCSRRFRPNLQERVYFTS